MSTITIDDIPYAEDALSDQAKLELGSMQLCDQKILALQSDIAMAQTARNAYASALQKLLPVSAPSATKTKPKPKPKAK